MRFEIIDAGLIDFKDARHLQQGIFKDIFAGRRDSAVILCQHYPVITLGRSAQKSNILAREDTLTRNNIQIHEVDRGGDVTYHGPGQLVVYPVLDLHHFKKDIHWVLRQLEELAIRALSDCGVAARRIAGATGAWCEDKKIASIGICVRKWITYHGLAINIKKNDLANFSLIRPCGMDIMMTSLESESGRNIDRNWKKL